MTIEIHKEASVASRVLEPRGFEEAWRLAQVAHRSGLCAVASVDAAMVIIGTGMELGLSAMQSLRGIYVIDGKPSLYAQTMLACVRASGLLESWAIVERTTKRCVIDAHRKGDKAPVRFEWTIERADAITFGPKDSKKSLTSKDVWKNDPTGMLFNRCTSEACRVLFSDVMLGLYTPEEMETRGAEVETLQAAPTQRATVSIVEPQPFTPPPSADSVETWRARFAAVTTKAELDALRKEVPAHLKGELGEAFKAAKARVDGPKDDGPKGGAKPVTGEHTQATGSGEHVEASDSTAAKATGEAIVMQWINHLRGIDTPQHVIHSVAAHVGDFDASLRDRVIAAGVARARSFVWANGKDVEAMIADAIAAKAA